MSTRHFVKKGDEDNEEVYQIFGSHFDSKNNQRISLLSSLNSASSPTPTSSAHKESENQTISRNINESNSSTKVCIDDTEKEEKATDEGRFCYIIIDCKGLVNPEEKRKVRKEIKGDYFQLARLSRKFQQKKQFYNFPFIKKFKFNIKSIKEDTFFEFLKSTQGEEFKITETNYYELYHLSKEWGTYELTNILKDYGERHKSNMRHIIEKFNYLTKEYDHQKEENIRKQFLNEGKKENKTDKGNKNDYNNNNKGKEGHKVIIKNKSSEIIMVEEEMKNRIEDCFRTNIFWEIRIDTIHRLIKETSKKNYSHDLLFECIMESVEEREKLIDLIDPYKISEINHQKLVDLQYKLVKEWKNNKQSNRQYDNNHINKNLIFELLQSYQESDSNENNESSNKFSFEEINNKLKRELKEKEKDIEQKGKELKELKEREMNFCNEIRNIKRKEREIKNRENEVERNLKENKNKENQNQKREKENIRKEEENKLKEEISEKRRKEFEIREKEIREREEKIDKEKKLIENKEKEINQNKEENEIKKEKIQQQEKNIIEREKKMEENKDIFEKEKVSFYKKMKEDEEKFREKEKQQQKWIELQNQVNQSEEEKIKLQQAKEKEAKEKEMELLAFLRENNLKSIDDSTNSYEAIHFACLRGNYKIVSHILSKNPNKLNVKTVLLF